MQEVLATCLTSSSKIGTSEYRWEPNEISDNEAFRPMCSSCMNTFMIAQLSSLTVVFKNKSNT